MSSQTPMDNKNDGESSMIDVTNIKKEKVMKRKSLAKKDETQAKKIKKWTEKNKKSTKKNEKSTEKNENDVENKETSLPKKKKKNETENKKETIPPKDSLSKKITSTKPRIIDCSIIASKTLLKIVSFTLVIFIIFIQTSLIKMLFLTCFTFCIFGFIKLYHLIIVFS